MRRLFAFIALAIIATPALAADLGASYHDSYKDAVSYPQGAPRWTGGYVGAGLGLTALVREDGGDESALGALQVGADYQWQRFVIGAFADVSQFDGAAGAQALDTAWSLGGRAGYLLSPDTLVYGLAAYTRGYGTETVQPIPGFALTADIEIDGLTLGGGFETHIAGNWFAGVEVQHTEFDGGLTRDAGLIKASYRFPIR